MRQDANKELTGILRAFERDDIPKRHHETGAGPGVLVFITYQQAKRIKQIVRAHNA